MAQLLRVFAFSVASTAACGPPTAHASHKSSPRPVTAIILRMPLAMPSSCRRTNL